MRYWFVTINRKLISTRFLRFGHSALMSIRLGRSYKNLINFEVKKDETKTIFLYRFLCFDDINTGIYKSQGICYGTYHWKQRSLLELAMERKCNWLWIVSRSSNKATGQKLNIAHAGQLNSPKLLEWKQYDVDNLHQGWTNQGSPFNIIYCDQAII